MDEAEEDWPHRESRDISLEVMPPPPSDDAVLLKCSNFLCAAAPSFDEGLTEYEGEAEVDQPIRLPRPLPWHVEIACRGGTWGRSPVPLRCEVCQVNLSSRDMHADHVRSPRHVRNSRRFYGDDSSFDTLDVEFRRPPKQQRRSRSVAPMSCRPVDYVDPATLALKPRAVSKRRVSPVQLVG